MVCNMKRQKDKIYIKWYIKTYLQKGEFVKFLIELDNELVMKYADFLGVEKEEYESEDFYKDEYFLNRLKEDLECIIDMALNP